MPLIRPITDLRNTNEISDFCHAKRAPFAAAAENNVFHFAAAQIFGTLFAQHPAHGIGDIAFTAAVRAYNYNCRYAAAKIKFYSVGKRFKAVCRKRF